MEQELIERMRASDTTFEESAIHCVLHMARTAGAVNAQQLCGLDKQQVTMQVFFSTLPAFKKESIEFFKLLKSNHALMFLNAVLYARGITLSMEPLTSLEDWPELFQEQWDRENNSSCDATMNEENV